MKGIEWMPRPRKQRIIQAHPVANYFKPQGIPLRGLEEVILPIEGLEALRLADVEGMEHAQAADLMGVSRPTFSRLLAEARRTVASALVRGLALRIQGGTFAMAPRPGGRQRHRGGRGW